MNIEALLEDLEAQGYFASTNDVSPPDAKPLCKSVLVVRENLPDVFLALPLLGKDFIAGFQNRITKSSWLVIRNYSFCEPQDPGTELQATPLTLKDIAHAHLIGVPLRVGLVGETSELTGYITKTFSKMLEFISFEAKTLWIPLAQVNYVVVDKLSMNPKV
jgi:hypothetical protein